MRLEPHLWGASYVRRRRGEAEGSGPSDLR